MSRHAVAVVAGAVLRLASAVSAEWELRYDERNAIRPAIKDRVVNVDTGDSGTDFPRYLNELGIDEVRIRFRGQTPGVKKLSIIWSGGSQGADCFTVSLDGRPVGRSRTVLSELRPYAWYRDEFIVRLAADAEHVIALSSPPASRSSVEFAALCLSDDVNRTYQPLCGKAIGSLRSYEAQIKDPGYMAQSEHLSIFVPASHRAGADRLAIFLERAYMKMAEIYGIEPIFRFSIEHYPPGHPRCSGGISGQATIGYPVEAIERFARWGASDVRGFAGYTEEMSHGFKACYRCDGTYEALGVAVQEDIVRSLVPPAVADAFWLPEHDTWRKTHQAYRAAGNVNPDHKQYPNGVLYTRILNHLFLTLRSEYGPRMWPDFFRVIRQMDYPLHRAEKTERLRTYADIFAVLFGRDMRKEFADFGIDLSADPPWGWQTYEQ